jgi:phage baseplate assembly protein W
MPLYKGYSTKQFNYSDPTTIVGLSDNDFGPYMLTDKNLIVMDLLNHFNTRKGERLMNPAFGCLIWDRLFEPMTAALKDAVVQDISDIISSDPRIDILQRVQLAESTDGTGLEVTADIVIKNSNELVQLNIAFDKSSGVANATVSF